MKRSILRVMAIVVQAPSVRWTPLMLRYSAIRSNWRFLLFAMAAKQMCAWSPWSKTRKLGIEPRPRLFGWAYLPWMMNVKSCLELGMVFSSWFRPPSAVSSTVLWIVWFS